MDEFIIKQTSDSSGNSVDTSEDSIYGSLYAVEIVDGDLSDNFDITLTYKNSQGVVKTLLTLANKSDDLTFYPREVMHGNTGSALTGEAGGDTTMPIIAGVVTSTLADGGNVNSGAVILYVL